MAKRVMNKLTPAEVKAWKGGAVPLSDGGGLYVFADGERKRFIFRYQRNRVQRDMGLGSATMPGGVTLARARELAAEARKLLADGKDPIEQRRLQEAAEANLKAIPTFGDFADEYVAAMRPSWKNEKHAQQWANTLTGHAAHLRAIHIDRVDTEAVLEVLRPIWGTIPVTAKRLRGRLETVLDAAKAGGLRSGENPARWAGHLKHYLPRDRRTTKHHRSLPYARAPEFMAALRRRDEPAARLLEFTVLTAARTTEARGAMWSEFDLAEAVWTVPAARMKAARDHRVPLSPRAVEIIRALLPAQPPKDDALVFPGRKGKRFSENAMIAVLKRMKYHAYTVTHGLRATCRTWAEDETDFPYEVREAALAHKVDDQVQAAYQRGDRFEKRRKLMIAWATYCAGGAEVVPFKRVAS